MPPPPRPVPTRLGLLFPTAADVLLAVAAVVTLFFSLQFSDDAVCVMINLGLFSAPFLIATVVGGRLRVAVALASAIGLLVWGIGELKMEFFGERLGLLDFYFLSEGANWSIVQRYPDMQWAIAAWLGLTTLLSVSAWLKERSTPALGVWGRGTSLLLLVAWCGGAWAQRHHHVWEVFREDANCGEDKICGVMARLVYSYGAFEFIEPSRAAKPAAFERAAQALPPASASMPSARPDVVVWLNESTLDPRQYRLDGAALPTLPMFEQTEHTRAAGLLRVHTFGGRTWLSEFSVLTGLVPADFGPRSSLVFNSVAPEVSSTLVHRFEAAGYDTVALMPTARGFYGAARTYDQIGFDRVLTLRDFRTFDAIVGDEWEISNSDRMAQAAVELLRAQRAKADGRPLFLYLLSIREHGPYSETAEVAYGLDRAKLTPSLASRLSDYVGRLEKLDAAIGLLERALTATARPAVWAYFGDHQANFDEPQPAYRHQLSEPHLVTQYQVRTNFPVPAGDEAPLLDIALLPSLVADVAGVPADAYFKAQTAMRRLCAGRLRDCPEAELVASYKGYLFAPELGLFAPSATATSRHAGR